MKLITSAIATNLMGNVSKLLHFDLPYKNNLTVEKRK